MKPVRWEVYGLMDQRAWNRLADLGVRIETLYKAHPRTFMEITRHRWVLRFLSLEWVPIWEEVARPR